MVLHERLEHVGLLIAVVGGAAVGLERQWSEHAEFPGARFARSRTFTMLPILQASAGTSQEISDDVFVLSHKKR